jgi:hypothetical protein
MNDEVSVSLPVVDLKGCEIETNTVQMNNFVAQGSVIWEDRLREVQKRIRTDHLNNQKRRAIINICEYYNIFKLLGDNLTTITAIEHAIPTPGVDPFRGIASRYYQILDALNGELQGIIDQMLLDKIIEHSNSPWKLNHYFGEKERCIKKKWRFVVDFRRLNAVMVGNSYH